MSTNTVIRVDSLTKLYGMEEAKFAAVNNLSFTINKGEFVSIMGPSGSGKSTLMHIMGGVDKPSSGNIVIDSTDLTGLSANQSAVFRRRKIGIVYQKYNLIPVLTVRENIILPLQLDHKKVDVAFLNQLIQKLGLEERLDSLPNQLSGGQQQRVSIGRALITRPSVLLADEPTGNLDSANSEEIMKLFQKFHKEDGQTLVIITHDPSIAAQSQRLIQMQDGRIVSDEVCG